MNTKEYYIKEIQECVISFNEFWEDPIADSALIREPKKNAELIISYCRLLQTLVKNNKYDTDYTTLPQEVKSVIDNIVNIVTDERDLRHKVEYHKCRGSLCDNNDETITRSYDHYVADNGHLPFENECERYLNRLIEECEKLIEVCVSEENTVNLTKYNDKILEWVHYEDGSYVIRID